MDSPLFHECVPLNVCSVMYIAVFLWWYISQYHTTGRISVLRWQCLEAAHRHRVFRHQSERNPRSGQRVEDRGCRGRHCKYWYSDLQPVLHSEGGWIEDFDTISTDTSAQIQETHIEPHTFEFIGTSIFRIFCKLFTCWSASEERII